MNDDRTQQLEIRITELERLNKSMVHRELKMVQLKQELKKFKQEVRKLKLKIKI